MDEEAEHTWLKENAADLMRLLSEAGALRFQGFTLPRTKPGFRRFCDALPLEACADPLSSIGVRSILSASDGVYEAVNAPALSKTFIGLHNDATFQLTAPFAAFVCFKPADAGGDFLLVDGRELLEELSGSEALDALVARNVSIRVAAIPAGWTHAAGALRPALAWALESAVSLVLRTFIPLNLQLGWSADARTLQVLESPKPAVNCHPLSGTPTFFSSLHSQSSYLQHVN